MARNANLARKAKQALNKKPSKKKVENRKRDADYKERQSLHNDHRF